MNIFPWALSPGLHIEGLLDCLSILKTRNSLLQLPRPTKAPFGERMIVDTTVQDKFEVELCKVTFTNPGWLKFVKDVASSCADSHIKFFLDGYTSVCPAKAWFCAGGHSHGLLRSQAEEDGWCNFQ